MRGLIPFVLCSLLVGCGEDSPQRDYAGCLESAFDPATGARIFALQPRVSMGDFESYEAYQSHLVGLVRTAVSPCLVYERPNVIVFPENTGLSAAFIGSRGQAARASTSAFAAFLALGGQYATPIQFYKSKWPDVPLPTQIELGITDTMWRAFHETNQLIARETGAWVVSSTNVSGLIEQSTDPVEIEALADPDIKNVSYVYVARDPKVYNSAFVYGPDGTLVTKRSKSYLVDTEEKDLALSRGSLQQAQPVVIEPLRLGIFTSKDAWMPDMVDRLGALGADVFVQPEAFSGWTIAEDPGQSNAWNPDIVSQSAMAAVRKHGAYRYGVVPHLTGNLFDMTFDGQSLIVVDPSVVDWRRAYVGQDEESGVLAVAPWVEPDPIEGDASLTLQARRELLRATGQQLLPGGARENQYVETVISADIAPSVALPVVENGAIGILGPSRPTSDGQVEQGHPAVAWSDSTALVIAYEEGVRGSTRVMVTTSEDGGATFSAARAISMGAKTQATPSVHVSGIYVYAAWQERDTSGNRIACAISSDRGKTFGPPTYITVGDTADSWLPSFASANGQVFLAYVDGASGMERVVVGRAAVGSVAFVSTAVEMALAHPIGSVNNNQWSPAIAASGNQVSIGWVDFRNGNWDVFLARSVDGGVTFGAAMRVDDGTDALERLHDDVSLAFVPGMDPPTLAVGWSDVRLRERYASARLALVAGTVIGQSRRFGVSGASAMLPEVASLGAGRMVVVWQDDRARSNDIYLSMSEDGGASFGVEGRVDDGGDGPSKQTSPVIGTDGVSSVVVAWEDSRTGQRRIRFAVGKP